MIKFVFAIIASAMVAGGAHAQPVQIPGFSSGLVNAVPAPRDKQPELNSNFGTAGGSNDTWVRTLLLTASGYPIISPAVPAPACFNPSKITEAIDAWKAKDARWMAGITGCVWLPTGVSFEWIKQRSLLVSDVTELRAVLEDGRRITLYAPLPVGEIPSWLMPLNK